MSRNVMYCDEYRSGKYFTGYKGNKTENDIGDEGTPVCPGSIHLSALVYYEL